jgi:hypothetical protein
LGDRCGARNGSGVFALLLPSTAAAFVGLKRSTGVRADHRAGFQALAQILIARLLRAAFDYAVLN